MRRPLIAVCAALFFAISLFAQTPPEPKKAEPKKPEKAEQEPRPLEQELQKQETQKKDAPPAPAPAVSPSPIAAEGPSEKKKDEKWDVAKPPGPRYDVPIDVTEGTWLSLDVSPDGKEIVIYTIF